MNRDASRILWQGGLTSAAIVVWTEVTALPWIASRLPAPDFSFVGTVGLLSAWVFWGAIAGIWADRWWLYLLESIVLYGALTIVGMSLLLLFLAALLESAGPAAMGLMLPFVFAIFAYPIGGLIRLMLKAAKIR